MPAKRKRENPKRIAGAAAAAVGADGGSSVPTSVSGKLEYVLPTALNLFPQTEEVNIDSESVLYEKVYPHNIGETVHYELYSESAFIDMNFQLYQYGKIVEIDKDGKSVNIPEAEVGVGPGSTGLKLEGTTAVPIFGVGSLMWESIGVRLNGQSAPDYGNGMLPYSSYMRILLEADKDTINNTWKRTALYMFDSMEPETKTETGEETGGGGGSVEGTSARTRPKLKQQALPGYKNVLPLVHRNLGLSSRFAFTGGSRNFEILSPLWIDTLKPESGGWLAPRTRLELHFKRQPETFFLMSKDKDKKFEFQVKDQWLWVRFLKLNPYSLQSYERVLQRRPPSYKFKSFENHYTTFRKGFATQELVLESDTLLPRMVIIALVTNSSFHSAIDQNPLIFWHHNLQKISIDYGLTRPNVELSGDFENGNYAQFYQFFLQEIDASPYGKMKPNITYDEFGSTKFILPISLTKGHDSLDGTSLEQPGRITIRFTFKEELKEELRCIRTEVRNRFMSIDSQRNVNFI